MDPAYYSSAKRIPISSVVSSMCITNFETDRQKTYKSCVFFNQAEITLQQYELSAYLNIVKSFDHFDFLPTITRKL